MDGDDALMTNDALLPDLRAGVYRHYKGPLYLVLGYAHDANADSLADYSETMQRVYAHNRGDAGVPNKPTPLGERTVVVYVGLQLDGAKSGARLAVRTVEDFFAFLHPDDFSVCDHFGTVRMQDVAGDLWPRHCHHTDRPTAQPLVKRFTYVGPTP